MSVLAKREIAYRIGHQTSRGGESLLVTFPGGVATVNLESAIYASSPLTVNASGLRRMADALVDVQSMYDSDRDRVRVFEDWLVDNVSAS